MIFDKFQRVIAFFQHFNRNNARGCKILEIKIAVRGQVHDTDSNM